MIRENCRTCGRVNVDDESKRCQQFQTQSGDYECPGDAPHDVDDEGFFLYRTEEEQAELEAFWERVIDDAKARGEI